MRSHLRSRWPSFALLSLLALRATAALNDLGHIFKQSAYTLSRIHLPPTLVLYFLRSNNQTRHKF
jgi:hypothetical protein